MAGGGARGRHSVAGVGGAQRGRKGGRGGKTRRGRSKSAPDDPAAIARSMAKIHLEEANGQYKIGLYAKGIRSYDLALELQPEDVEALVSRSRCHLAIGQPAKALKDAEVALEVEPGYIRGIYQKAEALYHLGDFEHSLMFYHRGHRTRPEMECFRLGVQKAQEAIQNTIGKKGPRPKRNMCTSNSLARHPKAVSSSAVIATSNQNGNSQGKKTIASCKESSGSSSRSTRQLLGELCIDKLYLENLLQHPDIRASHQEGCKHISGPAEEAVAYLNGREEFWRQQKVNGQTSSAVLTRPKKSTVARDMRR